MARAGCLFEGVVVTNVGCPFACGASPDIGWVGSSCYCCCHMKPAETLGHTDTLQDKDTQTHRYADTSTETITGTLTHRH